MCKLLFMNILTFLMCFAVSCTTAIAKENCWDGKVKVIGKKICITQGDKVCEPSVDFYLRIATGNLFNYKKYWRDQTDIMFDKAIQVNPKSKKFIARLYLLRVMQMRQYRTFWSEDFRSEYKQRLARAKELVPGIDTEWAEKPEDMPPFGRGNSDDIWIRGGC